MKDKSTSEGSFLTMLFFIFLILKLTNVIDWSWWWITAPLWFLPAFVVVLIVVIFLMTVLP